MKPKAKFVTGSSLVVGVVPNDRDIVCLFNNEEEINEFAAELGKREVLYEDAQFLSIRDGKKNYLCTHDIEFFYRFKAYSGALELLQIKDKEERKNLASACLYWKCPAFDL